MTHLGPMWPNWMPNLTSRNSTAWSLFIDTQKQLSRLMIGEYCVKGINQEDMPRLQGLTESGYDWLKCVALGLSGLVLVHWSKHKILSVIPHRCNNLVNRMWVIYKSGDVPSQSTTTKWLVICTASYQCCRWVSRICCWFKCLKR